MAQEQTFRSPGFFEREIDASAPSPSGPSGVPAAVIGTANRGPAFVPVTVGNSDEFASVFGGLDPKLYGPYAANEFLKNRSSLTYLRVLGAGANSTDADIASTQQNGKVKNAGVYLPGASAPHDSLGRHNGVVQFLVAQHALQVNESFGMPIFTDNRSYGTSTATCVRGMVLLASGARMQVLGGDVSAVSAFPANGPSDAAAVNASGKFKLVISSTLGNGFTNTDGNPGVAVFTASLDPSSTDYFAKILNRDPEQFVTRQHLLYADFAVDAELASATLVGALSGSTFTSLNSGDTTLPMRQAFGSFNTRYKTPTTPSFISQPFGTTEYDLFRFEALDDGAYANSLYKLAISNVKASTDASDPYGSFTVEVRSFDDNDQNSNVLERFPNCSLNPTSDNYVAKVVGDRHVTFNFDASNEDERRIVAYGKYANVSKLVRIVMNQQVEDATIPPESLPFGFRGLELPKTNDGLTDTALTTAKSRIAGVFTSSASGSLSGSILPPIPFRFKVTRGDIPTAGFPGSPGPTEIVSTVFYWGVKFERNTLPLNPNLSSEPNNLISAYTKFLGIRELDTLVTGAGADQFNDNKFTLAKVALSNGSITHITSSVSDHMREAAYLREGALDSTQYTINDGVIGNRITLATILAKDTPANFNRFVPFTKFVTFMHGGYDGLNFLDRDSQRMNDKSTSFDAGGGAESSYAAPGLTFNPSGTGQDNAAVASYKTAVTLMTNRQNVNHNILCVPGIRESFLTDLTAQKVKEYGLAFYVMDIPKYTDALVRLYDDSTDRPDVEQTANQFDSRNPDNNYAGTYFPDVFIDDATNRRKVKVPASVAAMGALGFNDRVRYPWFAPAGFNRAALDFVSNVEVRLNSADRDRLYESRINPIATFPRSGFVVWGQKTLQVGRTSLSAVNIRRLLVEVKRIVIDIALKITFEQDALATRLKFTKDATIQLGVIGSQAGVEDFRVIMNETNNTQEDADLNRLNGRVVVVPTRVAEFITVDFIVSNSGVTFV